MILHFLLLVVGVLLAPASKAALQPARFPSNALHNVDVGLNNIDGTVAAFADFNSDKLLVCYDIYRKDVIIAAYLQQT